MRIFALLVIAFVFMLGNAAATEYYVSETGNNVNDGLTEQTAWATPSYAITQVTAGDTVYLNGTWLNERLIFAVSGVEGSPITITNLPGCSPVLYTNVGHANWGSQEFGYFGIEIKNQSYISISGLTMGGYLADVFTLNSNNIHVSQMTHHPVNGYDSKHAIMMYYNVTDSSYTDSTCDQVYHDNVAVWGIRNANGPRPTSNILVDGNTVVNSTTHALIDLNQDVCDITVSNNYLEDADSDGVWMHGYLDDNRNVTITSNTFNNLLLPIRLINTTNVVVTNNVFTRTSTLSSCLQMYGPYGSNPVCWNRNVLIEGNSFDQGLGLLNIESGVLRDNTLPAGEKCIFVNSTATVYNHRATDFTVQVNSPSVITFVYDIDQYTRSYLGFNRVVPTAFIDETGRTWTNYGASLSTSTFTEGNASGRFANSVKQHISTTNTTALLPGNQDFTLEFDLKLMGRNAQYAIIGNGNAFADVNTSFLVYLNAQDYLTLAMSDGTAVETVTATSNIVDFNWHSLVVQREGGIITMYKDGVQVASEDIGSGFTSVSSTTAWSIGQAGEYNTAYTLNANVDHLRYSIGVARY